MKVLSRLGKYVLIRYNMFEKKLNLWDFEVDNEYSLEDKKLQKKQIEKRYHNG